MTLSLDSIDLCELIQETMIVFDEAFHAKGIQLQSSLPLHCHTQIDIQKTETILVNLLSNALKFTQSGNVTITLNEDGKNINIKVRDTGCGIAAKEQEYVFDRFAIGPSPKSSTGLGLTLSRQLARFMDGDVMIEQSDETGSTFMLTLPLIKAGSNDIVPVLLTSSFIYVEDDTSFYSTPSNANLQDDQRRRVLVVEDNQELRDYICRVMSPTFVVIPASDGAEAAKIALEISPDAVVSDVVMPRLDGFGLLQFFQSDPTLKDIPFLLLTARASVEDERKGMRLGVDQYLVKPFHPDELIEKVSTLIRRRLREKEGKRLERQSLMGDLHDLVGSDLTDLLLLLQSMQPNSANTESEVKINQALTLTRSVLGGLRGRIHEGEDIELIQQNFMHGIKVILNRRYSAIGRRIKFSFQRDEEAEFVKQLSSQKRMVLYPIFLEITTNDLKYGKGVSLWTLTYKNQLFTAYFSAESNQTKVGRLSFIDRLQSAGGHCEEKSEQNSYTFRLNLHVSTPLLSDRGNCGPASIT